MMRRGGGCRGCVENRYGPAAGAVGRARLTMAPRVPLIDVGPGRIPEPHDAVSPAGCEGVAIRREADDIE